MNISTSKITPFLWFDGYAEDAVAYYVNIFDNSRILNVSHYGKEGYEVHGQKEGTAMVVVFELENQTFNALNGGPAFRFSEAISFAVNCDNQEEVDYYWDALGKDGPPEAQQCGWLKDKFGLSWQIVPRRLPELLTSADQAKTGRVMNAVLQMKKIDIEKLENA